MEPVELNQRAKLCLLACLKFLTDKQVLSDTQFHLGWVSVLRISAAFATPSKAEALGAYCVAACALTCSHSTGGM